MPDIMDHGLDVSLEHPDWTELDWAHNGISWWFGFYWVSKNGLMPNSGPPESNPLSNCR